MPALPDGKIFEVEEKFPSLVFKTYTGQNFSSTIQAIIFGKNYEVQLEKELRYMVIFADKNGKDLQYEVVFVSMSQIQSFDSWQPLGVMRWSSD